MRFAHLTMVVAALISNMNLLGIIAERTFLQQIEGQKE